MKRFLSSYPNFRYNNYQWNVIIIFVFLPLCCLSQEQESSKSDNLPVDYPRIFQLAFTRAISFAPASEEAEFAPINSLNSGTYSLGISVLFPPVNYSLKLRLQPNFSWTSFNYTQEESKTFPSSFSDTVSFDTEKHSFTYIELPVGIVYLITKDEDGDPIFYVEAGGFVGYQIGNKFKTKFTNSDEQVIKNKINNVRNVKDFRGGIYGRIGYKWISLYYSNRLTNVFEEASFEGSTFPDLPQMEIGISVFL